MQEIERKFLLIHAPNFSLYENLGRVSSIRQGYVSKHDKGVVRIRQDNDDFIITVKGTGVLSREEHEINILFPMAELLFSMCIGSVIHKTRHRINHDGLVYEVDIFEGNLSGLVLLEIEFSSEEEARAYTPSLLQELIIREVTTEKCYANLRLALDGLPDK